MEPRSLSKGIDPVNTLPISAFTRPIFLQNQLVKKAGWTRFVPTIEGLGNTQKQAFSLSFEESDHIEQIDEKLDAAAAILKDLAVKHPPVSTIHVDQISKEGGNRRYEISFRTLRRS